MGSFEVKAISAVQSHTTKAWPVDQILIIPDRSHIAITAIGPLKQMCITVAVFFRTKSMCVQASHVQALRNSITSSNGFDLLGCC